MVAVWLIISYTYAKLKAVINYCYSTGVSNGNSALDVPTGTSVPTGTNTALSRRNTIYLVKTATDTRGIYLTRALNDHLHFSGELFSHSTHLVVTLAKQFPTGRTPRSDVRDSHSKWAKSKREWSGRTKVRASQSVSHATQFQSICIKRSPFLTVNERGDRSASPGNDLFSV